MRESKAWQAARKMPKGKDRNAAFAACNEKFKFSEYAVQAIATKHKNAGGFDEPGIEFLACGRAICAACCGHAQGQRNY